MTDQLSPSPATLGHGCNKPPHQLTAHPRANTHHLKTLSTACFHPDETEVRARESTGPVVLPSHRKETRQTRLRYWITGDLKREKVVFRSRTEHRLQVHVLATSFQLWWLTRNGTAPYLSSRSKDTDSIPKSRAAGTQDCRLHGLHPAAALLTYLCQSKFRFML